MDMLDSITIKNFKAIQSEEGLTLKDLKSVNYLVGKNGSGKSSVLESILDKDCTYWVKHNGKNYGFSEMEDKLEVEFDYKGEEIYELTGLELKDKKHAYSYVPLVHSEIVKSINNKNYCTQDLFSKIHEHTQIQEFYFDGHEELTKSEYKAHKEDLFIYEKTKLVDKLNKMRISDSQIVGIKRDDITGNIEIVTNSNKKITPEKLSEGQKNLINLEFNLENITHLLENYENVHWKYEYYRTNYLILIEEPEQGMHPSFQKKIPFLLSQICKYYPSLTLIITTHSPFLISAAAEFDKTQKVYLIESGQTVDLNGKLGEGINGYSGKDCIFSASKMLGSSIQDFAPSKIVFGEKSLRSFLKIVNSRFYNKNIQFKEVNFANTRTGEVGESGSDYNIVDLFEKYEEIFKVSNNLYEDIELIFVIDTPPKNEIKKIKDKILAHKAMNVFVLTTDGLEENYPERITKDFNTTTKGSKRKQQLAEYAGNNITGDEFEKILFYPSYGNDETTTKNIHDLIFN